MGSSESHPTSLKWMPEVGVQSFFNAYLHYKRIAEDLGVDKRDSLDWTLFTSSYIDTQVDVVSLESLVRMQAIPEAWLRIERLDDVKLLQNDRLPSSMKDIQYILIHSDKIQVSPVVIRQFDNNNKFYVLSGESQLIASRILFGPRAQVHVLMLH